MCLFLLFFFFFGFLGIGVEKCGEGIAKDLLTADCKIIILFLVTERKQLEWFNNPSLLYSIPPRRSEN